MDGSRVRCAVAGMFQCLALGKGGSEGAGKAIPCAMRTCHLHFSRGKGDASVLGRPCGKTGRSGETTTFPKRAARWRAAARAEVRSTTDPDPNISASTAFTIRVSMQAPSWRSSSRAGAALRMTFTPLSRAARAAARLISAVTSFCRTSAATPSQRVACRRWAGSRSRFAPDTIVAA